MKGTVQLIALSLACLATACTTTVDVDFEDHRTLSRYSTWDWRPDATPSIEANPEEKPVLQAQLDRLIDQALRRRGFQRARHDADIFLTYHLAHRLRVEVVNVPMAAQFVASLHASPSYWIEGSTQEQRIYRDVRLAIVVTQADGRTLWQASLERRAKQSSEILLEDIVGSLIEQFPGGRPQVE